MSELPEELLESVPTEQVESLVDEWVEEFDNIEEMSPEERENSILSMFAKMRQQAINDLLLNELPVEIAQQVQDEELESIAPADGIDKFVDSLDEPSPSTIDSYRTKLNYVEEYLTEVVGIEDLNNLSNEDVKRYKNWRKYESLDREEPLANITLNDDMKLFARCLRYLAICKHVPSEVCKMVEFPTVDDDEAVDKQTLDADRAGDILDYLEQYEYVTLHHVTLLLLAKTGRRPVDLRALDVDDFGVDEKTDEFVLEFNHRPEAGTELKADEKHEAKITLSEDIGRIIEDYIDCRRKNQTDTNDREPLLTTRYGRISKSTIKQYAYQWTRPCSVGNECPYGKDPESCEAATDKDKASECPGSRSPKNIRSGYVTAKLTAGASYEAVGHRVGATKKVLERHYDHPDPDEERKRYSEEIMTSSVGPESGYAGGE